MKWHVASVLTKTSSTGDDADNYHDNDGELESRRATCSLHTTFKYVLTDDANASPLLYVKGFRCNCQRVAYSTLRQVPRSTLQSFSVSAQMIQLTYQDMHVHPKPRALLRADN